MSLAVVPDELKQLVKIYENDLPVPDLFAVEYTSCVSECAVS